MNIDSEYDFPPELDASNFAGILEYYAARLDYAAEKALREDGFDYGQFIAHKLEIGKTIDFHIAEIASWCADLFDCYGVLDYFEWSYRQDFVRNPEGEWVALHHCPVEMQKSMMIRVCHEKGILTSDVMDRIEAWAAGPKELEKRSQRAGQK